jgi:2-keto-4-pentenoate hydratase/2-oxohepta-3-ene-1,7-dioic acid hydratase in catechol pathway
MKLVTIDEGPHGTPGAILKTGDILRFARAADSGTLEAWIPETLRALLEAGKAGLSVVQELVDRVEAASDAYRSKLRDAGALTASINTRLLTPISEPRLIVCGSLNYRSHLKEMSDTPVPPRPTGFIKIAASVTGPDAPISVPTQAPDMVDWEGEVACVIGRRCHNVAAADAMDYIAGYTVVNDISARDWVGDAFKATAPWDARLTWEVNIMGKQFAGFTAVGPVIVTVDEINDPNDLTLQTRLNGEVVQNGNTSDVVFDFAASIAFYSRWYTFQPGDMITTGTPAGVGAGRKPPRFMGVGDTIEVEVSRIGVLRNTLVA